MRELLSQKLGKNEATFVKNYSTGGLFFVTANGCASKAEAILASIVGELKNIAGKPVDITAAKNKV